MKFYLAVATTPTSTGVAGNADDNARAAFRSVLGTTEAAFTRSWLASLRQLAAR